MPSVYPSTFQFLHLWRISDAFIPTIPTIRNMYRDVKFYIFRNHMRYGTSYINNPCNISRPLGEVSVCVGGGGGGGVRPREGSGKPVYRQLHQWLTGPRIMLASTAQISRSFKESASFWTNYWKAPQVVQFQCKSRQLDMDEAREDVWGWGWGGGFLGGRGLLCVRILQFCQSESTKPPWLKRKSIFLHQSYSSMLWAVPHYE